MMAEMAVTGWRRAGAVTLVVLGCVVATLGVLTVIAGAFVMSFDAIKAVGVASGMNRDIAWMLPVSVDGAMAIATVVAILLHLAGRRPWYPWVVVACGVAMSVACNAAHAQPVIGNAEPAPLKLSEEVAQAVSSIPALTLALSVHLLMTLALAVLAPGAGRVSGDTADATASAAPLPAPDTHAVPAPVTVTTVAGGSDAAEVPVSAPPRPSRDMTAARDTRTHGIEMAAAGATADEIRDALGVSARTAYRYVNAARQSA